MRSVSRILAVVFGALILTFPQISLAGDLERAGAGDVVQYTVQPIRITQGRAVTFTAGVFTPARTIVGFDARPGCAGGNIAVKLAGSTSRRDTLPVGASSGAVVRYTYVIVAVYEDGTTAGLIDSLIFLH